MAGAGSEPDPDTKEAAAAAAAFALAWATCNSMAWAGCEFGGPPAFMEAVVAPRYLICFGSGDTSGFVPDFA